MKDLVELIAKALVDHPDQVSDTKQEYYKYDLIVGSSIITNPTSCHL